MKKFKGLVEGLWGIKYIARAGGLCLFSFASLPLLKSCVLSRSIPRYVAH